MLRFINRKILCKFASIISLSLIVFGILSIFTSFILAHHGEGIATRRPNDIIRGIGIAGSLGFIAGCGLGLTNGIKPAVETLVGATEEPATVKKDASEEEIKKEKEDKKPEPVKEKEEQEEEEEKKDEDEEFTLEDLIKKLEDEDLLTDALKKLIDVAKENEDWKQYLKHIDEVTENLGKMGKEYTDKWKEAILAKAKKGDIDIPGGSKIIDGAGNFLEVAESLIGIVTELQKKGYNSTLEAGCFVVEEACKDFLNYAFTKNPVVGGIDTVISLASGGKYGVEKTIDAGAEKWNETTQEYADNVYNNSDQISQQQQEQWDIAKKNIMSNPDIPHAEKVKRLKKIFNTIYK